MSKPENNFIARIHRLLPRSLHHEKMSNPYRRGTWDVWYSGNKNDLWIEYKYLECVPVRSNVLPDLTALQLQWGLERLQEGRNLAVIVGCPKGGVLYTFRDWEKTLTAAEFTSCIVPVPTLADWIRVHCTK